MEDKPDIIELIGIKKTRPILSCVRHHVEKWIERQQSLLFYPNRSFYRVVITHEKDSPIFTCELQVNIGHIRWTGCESGKTIQDSLGRTLAHLRSNPPPGFTRFKPSQAAHVAA